jgi:dsRNA-specific ribonuclease
MQELAGIYTDMSPFRLLRESGRASNSPIYVVGIFSGVDKLGEGFGNSLKMAEYRVSDNNNLSLPEHSHLL